MNVMLLFLEVLEDCVLKKWMLSTAVCGSNILLLGFAFLFPLSFGTDDCSGALKLQKEREKAKEERRKEKKREKKEKREKAGQENSDCKVPSHKKRKYEEKSWLDQKDGYNAKATTASSMEQLEKSGLTEEHEQPCSIQNTYDSSESSQDRSKRRKLVATNVSQASHGSILRIRLPLVKQKDLIPTSMPIAKQKGPTAPASMPIVKQKNPISSESMPIMKQKDPVSPATMPIVKQKDLKSPATVPTLNQTDLALTRTSEEPCFSGGLELEPAETPYSKSVLKRNSRICKMEMRFEELTANWNPPPLQLEHSDMGNQDWLFGSTKRCSGPDGNRCKTSTESLLSHLRNLLVDLKPSATMPALNQIDLVLTRTSKEPCFSGRVVENAPELESSETPYSKSSSQKGIAGFMKHEMERRFRELVANWKPPSLLLEHSDIGNQDSLFGSSK